MKTWTSIPSIDWFSIRILPFFLFFFGCMCQKNSVLGWRWEEEGKYGSREWKEWELGYNYSWVEKEIIVDTCPQATATFSKSSMSAIFPVQTVSNLSRERMIGASFTISTIGLLASSPHISRITLKTFIHTLARILKWPLHVSTVDSCHSFARNIRPLSIISATREGSLSYIYIYIEVRRSSWLLDHACMSLFYISQHTCSSCKSISGIPWLVDCAS